MDEKPGSKKREVDDTPRRGTRKSRRKKLQEPLRTGPDYIDQNHRGSANQTIAVNDDSNIYFVDEDYKNLTIISQGIKVKGGTPIRFSGNIEIIPREGEYITTNVGGQPSKKDRKFLVIRIEHILYGGSLRYPRIYIVIREVKNL